MTAVQLPEFFDAENECAICLDGTTVPVEVLPFGWAVAWRGLVSLGGHPHMRRADGEPYCTDNGNYILDVDFGSMPDPGALAPRIAAIPAVVDHGLFVGIVSELHVGEPGGARIVRREAD